MKNQNKAKSLKDDKDRIIQLDEMLVRAFNVSIGTVQYWKTAGMPAATEGMYDLLEITNWRLIIKKEKIKKTNECKK